MLEVYSRNQTIVTDDMIPFTSIAIQTGRDVTLLNNNTIQIEKSGIYEITLDVSGLPSASGDLDIVMLKNGVEQIGSAIHVPTVVAVTGQFASVTTFVNAEILGAKCCLAPIEVSFVNEGVGFTDMTVHATVRKIK